MTTVFTRFHHQSFFDRFPAYKMRWLLLVLALVSGLPSACTRFFPRDVQRDMAAEGMAAALQQANAGLSRFKCVGTMHLSSPDQPAQRFRIAIAGQLPDRLRIDMITPFGGSAGTISSDGSHLFLVRHPSREYYKRRYGNGSLRRIIKIDITVGDLLQFLVGRIPSNAEFSARSLPDNDAARRVLVFFDRWENIRQRVTVDDSMHPLCSVWYDGNGNQTYTLTVSGLRTIDGFALSGQLDLSAVSGERVSVTLDRYEPNARLDEDLFIPAPPSS